MSLLEKLDLDGIGAGTIIGPGVHALLSALSAPADLTVPSPALTASPVTVPGVLGATLTGTVQVSLAPGAGVAPALAISLDGVTLTLPTTVRAATRSESGSGRRRRLRYTDTGAPVTLTGAGEIRIVLPPDAEATVDVAALTLTPAQPHALLPGGIGLTLPSSITVEAGRFRLPGTELVLPDTVPVLGGIACTADLECGGGRVDLELAIAPAPTADGENAPAVGGTLAWHLPDAESFAQLVPTGVSMTLDLPQGAGLLGPNGPAIDSTLRVRGALSRPPEDPAALSITVTMESDAPSGLLSAFGSAPGSIAAGITTVLAPAVRADSASAATGALFATAAAIGSALARQGGFTLHGVTLDASTAQLGAVHALVDIEGAVHAEYFRSGPLGVGMTADDRPVRVRWRDVSATVDPTRPATEMLALDFSRARIEVIDPGTWTVDTPGSLLDIVGTRSGHGSTWFEIDLRFVVDLGPVRVSGATIRMTFDDDGVSVGLRGLVATVDVPGVLRGDGAVSFTGTGFSVVLGIEVPPVGVAGLGFLRYDDLPQGRKVEIGFAIDLPGPIPLGPTGLGLYGVIGTFGHNARLPALSPEDPFTDLRRWKPWHPLEHSPGDVTIGMGVSVGTAPDNGFFLSALGVLGLTVPDFALRIGVDGTLLAGRTTITRAALDELQARADGGPPAGPAITVSGGLSATPDALDLALAGAYSIPFILSVDVPLAGHFPFGGADWWIRTGSDDGVIEPTGRTPGPISARVLPGTPFECSGWAFVMVHGAGIRAPGLMGPSGGYPDTSGFSIGVGAGIEVVIGAKGILWAEISASLWALISTRPQLLRVTGRLSGELGIGPFSVGLSAEVTLQIWTDQDGDVQYAYKLQICGEIDLVFDVLRECITVNTLDAAPAPLAPAPRDADWPWPEVLLADGLGRSLPAADGSDGSPQRPTPGTGTTPTGGWSKTPVVWPDVVPILSFPIAPAMGTTAVRAPAPTVNLGLVSSGGASITWTLQSITLDDVTDPSAITSESIYATSRWQVPAGTGSWPAGTSNARELVLLRRSLHSWAAHLAGDGATLGTKSPAELIGGACLWDPTLGPGWALGQDATPLGHTAWHVPAESSEWGSSVVSSFANGTGFTIGTVPVTIRGIVGAGVPAGTLPTGPYDLPGGAHADGRAFRRALRLRSALVPLADSALRMRTTLTLDHPVVSGRLHLLVAVADGELLLGTSGIIASVRTRSGSSAAAGVVAGEPSEDGEAMVVTIELPHAPADPLTHVIVDLPWGRPAALLGLLATTAKDAAAAKSGKDAQAESKAADADGAQQPSKLAKLLKPGRRYRLSVGLGWESAIDVAGVNAAPAASPQPVVSSWFFRTAGRGATPPKPSTAAQKADQVKSGGVAGFTAEMFLVGSADPVPTMTEALLDPVTAVMLQIDTFNPSYLARYVKGFTPADRTEFLFPGDEPGIEFSAMHIVELAGLYQREVGLRVRRVDRAAPDLYVVPFPQPVKSKPKFALSAAVELVALKAGCVVLPSGAALRVPQRLELGASYELSCVLPEAGDAPDRWTPAIGGITFTTSHFDDPAALVASFGFGTPTSGRMHGDLRVDPVALTPGWVQDDAELERTIDRLGLPPLRPVQSNRSSVLWAGRADGSWAVVGLLVESTEPLVRDGGKRMGLRQGYLNGVELTVRRANRAGTVALWLATAPRPVGATATLKIRVNDGAAILSPSALVTSPPRFTSSSLTTVEAP